jgi:hypothetical protein
MEPSTPAAELRAELLRLRKTIPFVISDALGPLLRALDTYVGSIEERLASVDGRLQGLDQMPSSDALTLLITDSAASERAIEELKTVLDGSGGDAVLERGVK